MRKQNTSNTPAVPTEEVTTTPNESKRADPKMPFVRSTSDLGIVRRRQQRPSYEPMKTPDGAVEHDELDQLVRGHGQDAADQHLLDVLGALRGAIDDEHR